jgi:hypothetical protein
MTNQKKALIAVAAVLLGVLVIGLRIYSIYKERKADETVKPVAVAKADPDDLVFLKKMRPDSLKDMKDLVGKTVWVSAGGQLDYYPYAGHKANYNKSEGLLLGADPLIIKDVVEQVAPTGVYLRIPRGDKQVLLVFTLPKDKDPAAEHAVPVGDKDAGTYDFKTDEIFFYDDPHKLYSYWTPEQWAAIDAHKVIPGMSERQTQLSLGQVSKSESTDQGNRTVTFDDQGHPVDVTFVNNKATTILPR